MHSATPGSLFQFLTQRQISTRKVVLEYPYLGKWRPHGTLSNSGFMVTRETLWRPVPPFAVCFTKERGNGHYLTVADEGGFVGIYDTSISFPGMGSSQEISGKHRIVRWSAHTNAIFDTSWIKDDTLMLTGSGDQTIRVWDVERTTKVAVMVGHTGSVKSLSANPTEPDIFVSGSRDGSFAFWDIRAPATVQREPGDGSYRSSPVAKVGDAHTAFNPRSRRRTQGLAKSVTAVLYLKDLNTVVSGGANDGVVKYWDTRKLTAPVAQTPPEVREEHITGISVRAIMFKQKTGLQGSLLHGISGLSLDSTGTRLIATCVDSKIYMYDAIRPEGGALKVFSGHVTDTFYVKATFSPDGGHILSGSSDRKAYIWKVDGPNSSPTTLEGHEGEVTAVSWCQSDFCKVATCADDTTVRIWTLSEPQFGQRVITDSARRTQLVNLESEASPISHEVSFPPSELRGASREELRLNPNGCQDNSQKTDAAFLSFSPPAESRGALREKPLSPNALEETLHTTDVGVPSSGTSHNSRNEEAAPTSSRMGVSQDSPVGKGKENMVLEGQRQLESPQPKISSSPSSVLSPPRSIPKRRKTIVDFFGVPSQSLGARSTNHDNDSTDTSSTTPPNKAVRRV